MKLFFKRLQHEGVRRFCRSLPVSNIAARLVGGEAEARDVWELQPPGMGIGQRAASNGETGCKAWRGEIYIHGRAGDSTFHGRRRDVGAGAAGDEDGDEIRGAARQE